MKIIYFEDAPEKILKRISKNLKKATFFSYFALAKDNEIYGKIDGERAIFFRPKKHFFSIFSMVIDMKISAKEKGSEIKYMIRRPIISSILCAVFAILFIFTGIMMTGDDLLFILSFYLSGSACALPLFIFSRREEKRLLSYLQDDADNACRKENISR